MNDTPTDPTFSSLEEERDASMKSAQSQNPVWFYSCEGERIGPVTFSELRIKAKEGGLNPRLDLAWKHGMNDWLPAGEIPGLFERREIPVKREELAPAADPYSPPKPESPQERMAREEGWPGVGRGSFLLAVIIFPIIWNLGIATGLLFFGKEFGPEIMGFVSVGAPFVPVLVAVVYGVKRLINVGMSGWWYLGNFVPILNFWVGYRCFACPPGYAYHKKLDGIGVVLAIIYWLLVLISIVAGVAAIVLLLGMAGSPELQEKVREAIQHAMAQMPKK
ncbi:MAG: GYF domain-containing protein [Luteolibacter sp.]